MTAREARRRITELEEALRPFAVWGQPALVKAFGQHMDMHWLNVSTDIPTCHVTLSDWQRAWRILEGDLKTT
mgnify:CR=1 FL=1